VLLPQPSDVYNYVGVSIMLHLAVEADSAEADRHWPGSGDESVPSKAAGHGESGVQTALRGAGALSAATAGTATEAHSTVQAAATAQLGNIRQDTVSCLIHKLHPHSRSWWVVCHIRYSE